MYNRVERMEDYFKQLRSRVSPNAHSPIHPSAGQPSPLNGGTAMEHRMSPLHQPFPNRPSPQQHPLSNNIDNRVPTLEQLSHRQEEPEDGFSRRSSEDASSVSTDVLDIHAETSWTGCSEDSAASVNPALGTFKSLEHPASYHSQGSHGAGVASAVAPSARGAPEAAGLARTQLLPQFLEALNYLSDPQPGESEIDVLSRHLDGAKDLKLMARDAAVRSFMVEMGAAEVLVLLVNGVLEAEEGSELMDLQYQVAEEAAAALLNLSLDKTAKHMMRGHDVIPCIVRLADVTRSSPVCHDDARGSHALPSSNQQNDISRGSDGSTCNASASSAHLPLRVLAAEIIQSCYGAIAERGSSGSGHRETAGRPVEGASMQQQGTGERVVYALLLVKARIWEVGSCVSRRCAFAAGGGAVRYAERQTFVREAGGKVL
ncbi:unnamed protein product [Closterium sp. Yama58-4]|nr:unnamed protein product [Closterium sp. Yama58-4]